VFDLPSGVSSFEVFPKVSLCHAYIVTCPCMGSDGFLHFSILIIYNSKYALEVSHLCAQVSSHGHQLKLSYFMFLVDSSIAHYLSAY
jgi:hypothetical protein